MSGAPPPPPPPPPPPHAGDGDGDRGKRPMVMEQDSNSDSDSERVPLFPAIPVGRATPFRGGVRIGDVRAVNPSGDLNTPPPAAADVLSQPRVVLKSTRRTPQGDANDHPCSVCARVFPSWKALSGHMRTHPERNWRGLDPPPDGTPPPPLSLEDEVAASLVLLAAAAGGVASDAQALAEIFQCVTCKKIFPNRQALGGHRASHKSKKGCYALAREGGTAADDDDDDQDDPSRTAMWMGPMLDLNLEDEDVTEKLDLNLPDPDNESHNSSSSAPPPTENVNVNLPDPDQEDDAAPPPPPPPSS